MSWIYFHNWPTAGSWWNASSDAAATTYHNDWPVVEVPSPGIRPGNAEKSIPSLTDEEYSLFCSGEICPFIAFSRDDAAFGCLILPLILAPPLLLCLGNSDVGAEKYAARPTLGLSADEELIDTLRELDMVSPVLVFPIGLRLASVKFRRVAVAVGAAGDGDVLLLDDNEARCKVRVKAGARTEADVQERSRKLVSRKFKLVKEKVFRIPGAI